MQTLKEEVKDSIVSSATDEFLKMGFEKTSMRNIAEKSGITAGNLYRYFRNKEELFYHITTPAYNALFRMIDDHNNNDDHESIEDLDMSEIHSVIESGWDLFSAIFVDYHREILILIDGSRGTKYETAKKEIIAYGTGHAVEHLHEYYPGESKSFYKIMGSAISAGFYEGVLEILRKSRKKSEISRSVLEYNKVFITGAIYYFLNKGDGKEQS